MFISSDQEIVLIKRSGGDWEDSYEVPGGFVTPHHGNIEQAIRDLLVRNYGYLDIDMAIYTEYDYFINRDILESPLICMYQVDITADHITAREPESITIPHPWYANCEPIRNTDVPLHSPTVALFKYLLSKK